MVRIFFWIKLEIGKNGLDKNREHSDHGSRCTSRGPGVVEALSGTGLQRLKVERQVCLYLGRDIA